MTTLVTGGTGFVGMNVVEALAAAGETVIALGHAPPPAGPAARLAGRATFHVADIRDAAGLRAALVGRAIERLVHTAAVTAGPARERDDPGGVVAVNVGGTVEAMRLARDLGVRRVVALSSVAVYGFADPGASGSYAAGRSPTRPAALYGITKLAAEQTALRLGEIYGIDTRAVRLGPVFGPHERDTGLRDALTPHFQAVALARAGREIVLPRPCRADWIYSRDAAAGIAALLAAEDAAGQVVDLGGGAFSDLPEFCRALATRIASLRWRIAGDGETPNVAYGLARDRAALDNGAIARLAGFAPAFDVARAAIDHLDWLEGVRP
ncbi:MAG: NAD(P)-dependent oxidoreductase [Alphaproteobacteria bacterium]|nr:NAD(P)-dependent oxidoreductase [Alphaproteobacteria bacterium]